MYIFTVTLLCAFCVSIAQEIEPPSISEPLLPAEGDQNPSLVRCPRPMCKIYCRFGFKKGDDGCDICHCRVPLCEPACEGNLACMFGDCDGPACTTVKSVCKPNCRMFKCSIEGCPSGRFQKDKDGCNTCICAEDSEGPDRLVIDPPARLPCPMPMCANRCEYGYKYDDNGCMNCECKMVGDLSEGSDSSDSSSSEEVRKCPAVMCMMFCEHGFKKDNIGCDICSCRDEPVPEHDECDTTRCGYGLGCKMVKPKFCSDSANCSPRAACLPRGLCELQREAEKEEFMQMKELFGRDLEMEPVPTCLADGSYSPKQCSEDGSYCWCVDDMGAYIEGTKMTAKDMANKETDVCSASVTAMMDLVFNLEHDMEDGDLGALEKDLNKLLKEMMSSWMGVDPESIIAVSIEHIGPNAMMVKVVVIHDGISDLPSAAHNMHKNFHAGNCDLHVGGGTFKPRPNTMHVKAHRTLPEGYEDDAKPLTYTESCFARFGRIRTILAPLAGILAVVLIVVIVAAICKKRQRTASYQFQHRRLENMENFKKNLILSSEWEKPELVANDEVKVTLTDIEKKPLA